MIRMLLLARTLSTLQQMIETRNPKQQPTTQQYVLIFEINPIYHGYTAFNFLKDS